MGNGMSFKAGRDMPPGLQEKMALQIATGLMRGKDHKDNGTGQHCGNLIRREIMNNYICINDEKTELTDEQIKQIRSLLGLNNIGLSEAAVGDTVNIGTHELVVLDHVGAATMLICKDLLFDGTRFGSCNNYDGSHVDELCNGLAEEIAATVGKDNLLLHTVDLTSDDGLKDYGAIKRRVSLLTTEQYRRYVEVLDKHKLDKWWWLATAYSTSRHDNSSWVKCVSPSGLIFDDFYYGDDGVRPFCILKSNIFVSK